MRWFSFRAGYSTRLILLVAILLHVKVGTYTNDIITSGQPRSQGFFHFLREIALETSLTFSELWCALSSRRPTTRLTLLYKKKGKYN